MIRAVVLCWLATAPGASARTAAHDPFARAEAVLRDDATLNDVTFLDDRLGWAVGNRGAILHTRDGGRTWQDQGVRLNATLEAVHFVNGRLGYVVGGSARPDGVGCYGVMLRTQDGGQEWQVIPGLETGWLHAVWTDGQGNGWLLGEPTVMHAAGLWRFSKDGRHVHPAGDRTVPVILAAAFQQDGRGIAVGAKGTCIALRQGDLAPDRRRVSFQGRLAGVAMVDGRRACMVGDDATILVTEDAGRTWTAPTFDVPTGLRELLDLTDVAFGDPQHGWAVGANGRYVVRTVNGGKTWGLHRTGLPAPLRAICAIDAGTIVGVGRCGLIARSDDGGKTWTAVRNGDRRVGALIVSAASARRVWPLMAHLVGHYRCRVGYLRVTSDGTEAGLVRWAANACGVSTVQAFTDFDEPTSDWAAPANGERLQPIKSAAGLFRYWSQRLDRDAEDAMRRQIAADVRDLQPTLVITDQGESEMGGDLLGTSVAWMALEAVSLAEQADVMAEHRQIGLEPHQVTRMLEITSGGGPSSAPAENGAQGLIHLGFADELHPLLGLDSRLAGLKARGYLGLPLEHDELKVTLRVVQDATPAERPRRLLSGMRLSDAARYPWTPSGDDKERLSELESVTDALTVAGRLSERRGNPSRLVQLALRASEEFPGALAPADALYQAARQHVQLGHHRAAAEVWRAFLDLGKSHPAWSSVAIRQAVIQASAEQYMSLPIRPTEPLQEVRAAIEWLKRLCMVHPYLAAQPEVLFAQAHCYRVLNEAAPARQFYRRCALSDAAGWSSAAAAELWLMQPEDRRDSSCPRAMADARRASAPVQIDGRLDDTVWQGGSAPILVNGLGRRPVESVQTVVRFAWDDTYLYLAATIGTTHGRAGPPRGSSPKRDQLDKDWPVVEWFLDVDRDAATYYRIGVDELGNALDAHDDDLTWNLPLQASQYAGAWQYSVQHDKAAWTVEMSVPMASMFPRRSLAGQVWAVQVARRPASNEPRSTLAWLNPQPNGDPAPEYFGLLLLAGNR